MIRNYKKNCAKKNIIRVLYKSFEKIPKHYSYKKKKKKKKNRTAFVSSLAKLPDPFFF